MEKIFVKQMKVKEVEQAYEDYVNWCDDVVASIEFDVNGSSFFLSIYQKDNMPGFYLSEEDIFNRLLHVRQFPELMKYRILYFAGFKVDWYENIYPAIYRLIDTQYAKLLRLICYMARENIKDVEEMIKHNKKKFLDDIEIPTTDIEEQFFEGKLAW